MPSLPALLPLLGTLALSAAVAAPKPPPQAARNPGTVELKLPGQAKGQSLYSESYALVIGASRYQHWSELNGVLDDVSAVKALLQRQGFKVQTLMDPTRGKLDEELRSFANGPGAQASNRLLIYFAGHGHTLTTGLGKKLGYIVPVDAPRPDKDATGFRQLAYSMENFEQLSRQIEAKHVLFLFDSCFSGTVFRARSDVPDAISELTEKPVRLFITAGDESQRVPDESIFRRQLERALGPEAAADANRDGYITGSELGSYLFDQVTAYSKRAQTPRWGKLNDPDLDRGDFVFLAPRAAPAAVSIPAPVPVAPAPEVPRPAAVGGLSLDDLHKEQAARDEWTRWQKRMQADFDTTAKFAGSGDLQARAWERFLQTYAQDNPFSQADDDLRAQAQQRMGLAREKVARASIPAPAPPPVMTPTPAPAAPLHRGRGQVISVNGVDFEMLPLPAGSFTMGSPDGEQGRESDEGPQRRVKLAAFQLGRTEVTQGLWQAVMGKNPSKFKDCGADCPVDNISWNDAQAFLQKLNALTGQRFRLPSEAEWEYAARARGSSAYGSGATLAPEQANFDGSKTLRVGSYAANGFGLLDMHGNVWEWVQDCSGSYANAPTDGAPVSKSACSLRVLRGGSWSAKAPHLRSAYRYANLPDYRYGDTGLRLARD